MAWVSRVSASPNKRIYTQLKYPGKLKAMTTLQEEIKDIRPLGICYTDTFDSVI